MNTLLDLVVPPTKRFTVRLKLKVVCQMWNSLPLLLDIATFEFWRKKSWRKSAFKLYLTLSNDFHLHFASEERIPIFEETTSTRQK
jgi:hypothetical protein